jgi:hypothetical protein
MKKSFVLLVLLSIVLTGFSQVKLDYSAKPKYEAKGYSVKGLSAASAFFLLELQQVEATTDRAEKEALYAKLQNRYGIVQNKVSALLILAENVTPEDLATYGVQVNNSAGGIYTATIPVNRFAEFAASGLCESIDVGEQMKPHLDNARENLGINLIHSGMYLPHGYDGTGVVVGVIDMGFEFCHPAFYNANGDFRVKRVWNQFDSTGTPPTGYSYGAEYTTEAQMQAVKRDTVSQTHATHVAGIAAGCGAPSGDGTTYKGIASNADMVFVCTTLEEPHILDAIAYIHHYAQSVGKPCVINMSFGSILGPHDGTADRDRFVTSYVVQNSDSLVLVASGGNERNKELHLEKQFNPEDTILITNLNFEKHLNVRTSVDIWSEKVFSVALTRIDTATNLQNDFTGFFTTGTVSDTVIETMLLASNQNPLQCTIKLSPRSPYNNRYHTQIYINSEGYVPYATTVILTIRCDSVSQVHAWCKSFTFTHIDDVNETVGGDDNYTMSGFGVNSDAVISVGSYVTKLSYTTYTGANKHTQGSVLGEISSFSSKGPTVDGRVKPDIAAPGQVIVAPYNRYATAGTNTLVDTIVWNDSIEQYGSLSGTSMSCPMVTGIVALWMQENPSLGADSVRAILHSTARNDQLTGNAVTNPNNTWGHGKVNAFGGLPTTTPLYLITASPEVDGTGSVSGSGVVPAGTHTLTATPSQNHVFVAWGDGNTDNPRTVTITCDTFFVATFNTIDYNDCDTIADFPWTPTFDAEFICWKRIDADGDGQNWEKSFLGVSSSVGGETVATTDNWLVSPAIEVNQHLKAKISAYISNEPGSQDCSFLLSTSGSEISDFTHVLATHTFATSEEVELSSLLDEFLGQTVRLAVRHHNCNTSFAMLILNDFTIEVMEDSVSVPSYADNSRYSWTTQGLQLNISNAEGHSLQIYDLTGRLVVSSPSADGSYRLPSAGMYIVRVDGFKPRKVMVMR